MTSGGVPRRPTLRELLLAYAPDDERERGFVERMLALLEHDDDPFARATFAPGHFTASAFVLSPACDELFLIHHKKLGIWVQPGGHVEPSDPDLLAAARREVAEEVGLLDAELALGVEGLFDVDIHPIPARRDEPAHEHFDVRFVFRAPSREAVQATDEVKAGRWLPLEGVMSVDTDESVARAVRKVIPLVRAR